MDDYKKKNIILSIIVIIIGLSVSGGTFAYFSTVVKGNGNDVLADSAEFGVIYNKGNPLTGDIEPSISKDDGLNTSVNIKLSKALSGVTGDILLNVTNISNNLKINGFKWESYKVEGNTETLLKSGNFANASNGSVISLVSNYPLSTTLSTIKIYIWLDAADPSVDNNVLDGTASFSGYISAKSNRLTGILDPANKILETLQNITYNNQDGVYYFDTSGNLDYGDGTKITTGIASNNLTIPKGVVSIWNNTIIYMCTNYNDTNYEYDLVTKTMTERNMPCIIDRYQNLVINGDLSYESNFNLKGFGTYNNDGYLSLTTSSSKDILMTDYIPIDPNKKYEISADMKDNNGTSRYYGGFYEYDADKKRIESSNVLYVDNSLTELTQDLKKGDSKVYLTNLSNWSTKSNRVPYINGFIF